MMNETTDILQEMSIKDILIRSYRLYRLNFIKLIGIVLLLKGPYLILVYIISKLSLPFLIGSMPLSEESVASFEYTGGILIVELLELIFIPFISPISLAAVSIFISEKYINKEIGITESYKKALKRAIPLLGTILISGILICSGFIIAVPVLVSGSAQIAIMLLVAAPLVSASLWVWFAFVPQIVVFEGEGGIGAMKRSKYLIDGYFRKSFILIPLVFAIILIITWIFSYVFAMLLFFLGDSSTLLGKGISNIVSVLLEPFRILIIPLLYYDLRVHKEGFDRELLIKELESEA
jgi:hypothetical protein